MILFSAEGENMKLSSRTKKIFVAFLLGIFPFGILLSQADDITKATCSEPYILCQVGTVDNNSYYPPILMSDIMSVFTNFHPLAFLFQIMFILFLISPPIIALMLFCIWKELKKRNELQ